MPPKIMRAHCAVIRPDHFKFASYGPGETKKLPVASTCAPAISLPTMYRAYDDFKTAMIEGIVGGFGFGLV